MPGRLGFTRLVALVAASWLLLTVASAGAQAATGPLIRLRVATFDPLRGLPALARGLTVDAYPDGQPGPFIVQFAGPVRPAWKQAVLAAGAELLDYIPDYAFIARMDAATRAKVAALPNVRWVGIFQPGYKLHPSLPSLPQGEGGSLAVVVQTFPPAGAARAAAAGGSARLGSTLRTNTTHAGLVELAHRPDVAWIEPARQPRMFNAASRGVMDVSRAWDGLGLLGQGQIVGVADSGLDRGTGGPEMSADFAGRILSAFAPEGVTELCKQTEWSDMVGHGTHVAGSIAGSGALSGADPAAHRYAGSKAGVAPEAALVVQTVFDWAGNPCFPENLEQLYRQAYQSGARIHSDSWGTPADGDYDTDARQTDDFAWQNPDMLIVMAAGNYGQDANQDGRIDPQSVSSPGTAKNALTVGASEGEQPPRKPVPPDSGGYVNSRWGDGGWDGADGAVYYRADPIRSDYISDNPRGIAAFSGRGPTADGRIKPDLVAPGTDIISARTHLTTTADIWGVYNPDYGYGGGTSMATPLVAGTAALVREFFTGHLGLDAPSSALIKSTLVNGAVDLTPGQYGVGQAGGQVVFSDDMEFGANRWQPEPPWSLSTSMFSSPFHAWTDSPSGDYTNNANTSLKLAAPLDLTGLSVPGLTFYHRYEIEYGYDFGHVEVSADGGQNWKEVGRYTGRQDAWARTQIRLGEFGGRPAVSLRFRLTSDDRDTRDGWSIDDVSVGPWSAQEVTGRPDFAQGFGRVDLAGSLAPLPPRAAWFDDHRTGLETGQEVTYSDLPGQALQVTTSALPLRVTLAWTDYPASTSAATALVNDLDLVVQGPDGKLYHGNGGTEPDRLNNVESVEIKAPPHGLYTIRVTATNVPHGPQPYALAVSGPFIQLPPRVYVPILVRDAR